MQTLALTFDDESPSLNRRPQNHHRQQKVIRMTAKNRRIFSLDWINSATLSVRTFLCLACCRCKECRFSNAAKSAGVHPSNRFAFLTRIPFCRRADPERRGSLRSPESNLCRKDSLPTFFARRRFSISFSSRKEVKCAEIYSKLYYFSSYKNQRLRST